MKITFIWPPERVFTGSLFKHYTYFGETIGYLNELNKYDINVMDCGVKQYSYSDLYKAAQSDVVIIYVETYTIKSAKDIITFMKSSNPQLKVVVYGTACCYIPQYFAKDKDIDIVVYNSNWEVAIQRYLDYLYDKTNKLCDVYHRQHEEVIYYKPGELIDESKWGLPPLDLLPVEDYFKVRGKRQLELAVNKGCGYNCALCAEKMTFGHRDYRRSIDSIIEFIKGIDFSYDTLYFDSTTFTFNKDWVKKLCIRIIDEGLKVKWRTVTRIDSIDDEIIELMAKAGCYKISFGVETLSDDLQNNINKVIKFEDIKNSFDMVQKYGIVPRALIILGLPNQTNKQFRDTFEMLKSLNCEIRVKEYIPYNELLNDEIVNDEIINRFDRHKYYCENMQDMNKQEYMRYLFGGEDL